MHDELDTRRRRLLEMDRAEELAAENARLRKLLAEREHIVRKLEETKAALEEKKAELEEK